jgi:hypothetical protein
MRRWLSTNSEFFCSASSRPFDAFSKLLLAGEKWNLMFFLPFLPIMTYWAFWWQTNSVEGVEFWWDRNSLCKSRLWRVTLASTSASRNQQSVSVSYSPSWNYFAATPGLSRWLFPPNFPNHIVKCIFLSVFRCRHLRNKIVKNLNIVLVGIPLSIKYIFCGIIL